MNDSFADSSVDCFVDYSSFFEDSFESKTQKIDRL